MNGFVEHFYIGDGNKITLYLEHLSFYCGKKTHGLG